MKKEKQTVIVHCRSGDCHWLENGACKCNCDECTKRVPWDYCKLCYPFACNKLRHETPSPIPSTESNPKQPVDGRWEVNANPSTEKVKEAVKQVGEQFGHAIKKLGEDTEKPKEAGELNIMQKQTSGLLPVSWEERFDDKYEVVANYEIIVYPRDVKSFIKEVRAEAYEEGKVAKFKMNKKFYKEEAVSTYKEGLADMIEGMNIGEMTYGAFRRAVISLLKPLKTK